MTWLLFWLLTKHFIVDFPLQPRWMYANKGTFGHPGGVAHALLHGAVTGLIVSLISPVAALWIGPAEAVAHYFIDWAKMNLNAKMGWGPLTSEKFWWLLGLDQWLHGMCYLAIIAAVS